MRQCPTGVTVAHFREFARGALILIVVRLCWSLIDPIPALEKRVDALEQICR